MGGYSERYLENVIRIMEDLSQEAMNKVYEWADEHELSGIDAFKDWIKDLATRFEEVWETFDEKDEVDYIEAVLQFVATIGDIEYDKDRLPVPTVDEVRPKILRTCTPVRRQIDRKELPYVWILEKRSNYDFITGGIYYYASLDALVEELEECGVSLTDSQKEATEKDGGAVWNTPKMLYRARKQGVIS